nr:site-specific integrase [uncultured Brumimicrobium sp.]
MATIDYRLNGGKKIHSTDKPLKIYLRYRIGSKVDFNASIGQSILFKDWNSETKKAKKDTNLNNLINRLTLHFEDFTLDNKRKGYTPNRIEVKKHFEKFFITAKPEPKQNNDTLLSYIDYLIERPQTKRELKESSINNYRRTKSFLKRFNDEVYPIDFDRINLEWYNDFVEWCESQNLSKNYIGKHIKTLKTFMNCAIEDNKTDNTQFRSKRFIVLREDADNVYLTFEELNRIWSLDLSNEPRKENARDLFLIGAYTGLRVSDYNNIKDENLTTVNGVKMFKIKTQKTGKEVAIPLHPIVLQILEKNNGTPPKRIPDQHINVLIKEVAESAGIDEVSYTTITKGGKEVHKKNYKFELVKTHTARRSFCTNAYLSNMSTIDIMAISGHTTEKAFLNYIKVTPEETAIRMSSHPFFKGQSNLKVV